VLPEGLLAEELALARFAAIWLRPNCYIDVEQTRQDRARHTDALYAADNFEAGQIIARVGQVVDGKILAALKQLGEKPPRATCNIRSLRNKREFRKFVCAIGGSWPGWRR
jgi:membrane-associated HD superfamily phosphohydrolase